MSISFEQGIVTQSKKPNALNSGSHDIDLLNYSANECESNCYVSDKSLSQLDLLLKPSELNRLIRNSSNDDISLLRTTCCVAKKPGFYLKQDMKSVNKCKTKSCGEESDSNVIESLLPRLQVTSRCKDYFKNKSMSMKNEKELPKSRKIDHHNDFSTEEDSTDETNIIYSKDYTRDDSRRKGGDHGREVGEEWLFSLDPRSFCKKRDYYKDPSVPGQKLHRRQEAMENFIGNTLSDLTQPFYRVPKKVERDMEKDLQCLGFNFDEDVNWNLFFFPKRRDVLRLLHYRLCHHINPDIIVVLDDHEFFCHKILLQSYSEYFDDLKMSDSQRVDITNMRITESAFLTIYTWMLSIGQSGFQLLTKRNILEVYLACQILKIKDLENQCIAFIENEDLFYEESAFFLYQNAVELKIPNVQTLMIPRIRHFFLILVSSKEFLELSLSSLCTLLKSDYIGIHCELEVFYAAIRWLNHMWSERKGNVEEVMACIRFGHMSPLELVELRKSEQQEVSDIVNHSGVQHLFDDGLTISVKNTLSKNEDNSSYSAHPPSRNWLGKIKSYNSFKDFVEFLKEIKNTPHLFRRVRPSKSESKLDNISDYPKREISEYQTQASETSIKQSGGSMKNDSGIVSSCGKCTSSEMNNLCLNVEKSETFDVSTNTYRENEYVNNLLPTVISEFLKKQMGDVLGEIDHRKPRAKLSEPVLTRVVGNKIRLRDQAATLIQAAFRGHKMRLRLLEALSTPSHKDPRTSEEPKQIDSPLHTSLSSLKKPSSTQILRNLLSESKLQEELTKSGSTFHLFQNTILVFGGLDPNVDIGPGNSSDTVYRYIGEKNKWDTFGTLPEPRYYHDVAILKGKVYLAGGVDPRKEDEYDVSVSKNVWSFDSNSGVWQKEADMITERKNFGLVAAGGFLYAIGGQNKDSSILSSVERYDPSSKKWTQVASLEQGRTGAAICKHNHMIWVAGGIVSSTKHQVNKTVECYDPKRDVWMAKSPLRFGRAFGALVSLCGSLYLIGGASRKSSTHATSTTAIDIWDERNKEWKLKTELILPRHSHSVAYVGSQMVVLGGTTTMSMRCVTTVESWCVTRGAWVRGIASLPASLIGHATTTLPLDMTLNV